MSRLFAVTLSLALAFATSAPAQQLLSGGATVNPTTVGSVVSMPIEANTVCIINSGCGYDAVHAGSPGGPIVFSPFICPFLLIIVGPGGPHNVQWQGTDSTGAPVPPGTYWIEIGYRDQATNTQQPPAFFPVRIDGPNLPPEPILTASGSSRGGATTFSISSPGDGGAAFFMAASFTTNTGIPVGNGDHVALDMDSLFNFSFFTPVPPIFNNFQGVLDANGMSTAPLVNIPNLPALQSQNIAWQALLVTGNGLRITNPITQAIQ